MPHDPQRPARWTPQPSVLCVLDAAPRLSLPVLFFRFCASFVSRSGPVGRCLARVPGSMSLLGSTVFSEHCPRRRRPRKSQSYAGFFSPLLHLVRDPVGAIGTAVARLGDVPASALHADHERQLLYLCMSNVRAASDLQMEDVLTERLGRVVRRMESRRHPARRAREQRCVENRRRIRRVRRRSGRGAARAAGRGPSQRRLQQDAVPDAHLADAGPRWHGRACGCTSTPTSAPRR